MIELVFGGRCGSLIAGRYSQSRGPVLRSIYLDKVCLKKGDKARPRHRPKEQVVYILEGRAGMSVGDETSLVEAGEATYHLANVFHTSTSVEDCAPLNFQNQVASIYEATEKL